MKNNIAALRKERGLTQQEIADSLGISKAAVAQYESGKIKTIKPENLLRLSEILNASPSYLMGWSSLRHNVNPRETTLLKGYRGLNNKGKEQLDLRLWELSQISDYTCDTIEAEEDFLTPVAAHADGADIDVLKAEIERIKKLLEETRSER